MPCAASARQSGRYRTRVLGGRGCARIPQFLVLTPGLPSIFTFSAAECGFTQVSLWSHCENGCEIFRARFFSNVKCEISHHEPCSQGKAGRLIFCL